MALLYLLVIGTSIWMAYESSSFGYKKEDIKGLAAMGPMGWLVAGLFLWIVAFPVYLASRAKLKAAGAKNDGSSAASRILYAEAYKLHHTNQDLPGALVLYKKIVNEQQGTPEALSAQSQIASIASGSNAPPPGSRQQGSQ